MQLWFMFQLDEGSPCLQQKSSSVQGLQNFRCCFKLKLLMKVYLWQQLETELSSYQSLSQTHNGSTGILQTALCLLQSCRMVVVLLFTWKTSLW